MGSPCGLQEALIQQAQLVTVAHGPYEVHPARQLPLGRPLEALLVGHLRVAALHLPQHGQQRSDLQHIPGST